MTARIADFIAGAPTASLIAKPASPDLGPLIHGVTVTALSVGKDGRGQLNELLTERDGPIDPIVHVYQVFAEPGSLRGWVYHKQQDDRLAFTTGAFRVVLFDIREDSPTKGMLNVFQFGEKLRVTLRIPAYVVHGVKNEGTDAASFVNMPTRVYDPANPDKHRLPPDSSLIPYSF
ncbi:MAG: dTDP-4-dehydrorhamnose 3,5-epimerase family protein [Proteobacteria bacterium]|nr:dTDP-4-dehydrorhamnose 3,5-epimerase family protein [Pseudomonadota bacterium]